MSKRSWAKGLAANPYQPEPSDRAAARSLALYARRYADDRATVREVVQAYEEWLREAARGAAETSKEARS